MAQLTWYADKAVFKGRIVSMRPRPSAFAHNMHLALLACFLGAGRTALCFRTGLAGP